MDAYSMFFKLLVSTIVTFIEAAMLLFAPAGTNRAPAPRVAPRLVHAVARLPERPDVNSLIAQLKATDAGQRARAACTPADMDPATARSAMNALVKLLGDAARVDARICDDGEHHGDNENATATPGESAAAALACIGAPAVDALTASLHSSEWFVRKNAAWALGAIGDVRAVPAVISALRDSEAPERRNVAWALGVLESKSAVMPLTEALNDADAETRANAACALGAIGEPRAAGALAAALKDRDAEVRRHAAWALGAIQHE